MQEGYPIPIFQDPELDEDPASPSLDYTLILGGKAAVWVIDGPTNVDYVIILNQTAKGYIFPTR